MTDYMQTIATVTNPDGQAVEIAGPSLSSADDMTAAWKAAYRPVMLDIASEAGLVLHNKGMRVTYRIDN